MSFWNNPENNTAKALLIIVLLGAVGFGIFKLAGSPDSNLQGSVFQGVKGGKAAQTATINTENARFTCDVQAEQTADACAIVWSDCSTTTGQESSCISGNKTVPCCCVPHNGSNLCMDYTGQVVPPTNKNTGGADTGLNQN